jgi:hypothetical protein
VEDILQYCTITDDGYVHYKDLMFHLAPEMPRAKQSSLKATIFPEEEARHRDSPTATSFTNDRASSYTSYGGAPSTVSSRQRRQLVERTDDIRQAYARWEKGQYAHEAFKAELQALGITLTKEFERLIVVHGASRNMTFGQLMATLQIDENDGRRARANNRLESESGTGFSSLRDSAPNDFRQQRSQFDEQSVCSSVTASNGNMQNELRQAICDYTDGRIPAVTFRRCLHHSGVPVTSELDRLIRTHESDNSVRFQEFARAVLRQDRHDHLNSGYVTPSGTPSYPVGSSNVQPSPSASGVSGHWRRSSGPSDAGSSVSGPQARPSQTPFASGGSFDVDSKQTTPRSRRSGPAPDNVPVFRPPSEAASRPGTSAAGGSHAYRGYGQQQKESTSNFLCWDTEPSAASAPRGKQASRSGRSGAGEGLTPRSRAGQQSGEMADCLHWPATRDAGMPGMEDPRAGKRQYAERAAARDILPWSEEDASYGREQRTTNSVYAAPFGTDFDLRYGRPEDAGTAEYLPAHQVDPRMRPI